MPPGKRNQKNKPLGLHMFNHEQLSWIHPTDQQRMKSLSITERMQLSIRRGKSHFMQGVREAIAKL